MPAFVFDFRDAVRGLRRDPGYAATVILTLALTVGATTAVFSLVNGVLLKPLAFRESHALVAIFEVWHQFADRRPTLPINEQHFEYWRQHARSFESLAQYIDVPANLTGAGDAAQIRVARASGSLFDVLQVRAALGRTLSPDDERVDRPRVAVISDTLWRQRFGADPRAIGRAIQLDGRVHTLVGVLPPDFRLPEEDTLTPDVDAFVPIRMAEEHVGWVGDHNNIAIGRLREGVTPERARAELDVLQAQVGARASQEANEPVTLASHVVPLDASIVGQARRGLLLLFGAIVAVLLIACSNLANLSLTRTLARSQDLAIRTALGAGRGRLIGRAILEQLVLATIGGAAGVWIASIALGTFVTSAGATIPRANEVAIDGRVLLFAAIVSMAAGLIVALLPAWRVAGRDVQGALRAGTRTLAGDRRGSRVRAVLLATQVALSVTLLVVTTLLAVSFVRLLEEDHGFVTDRVLAVNLSMPASTYADDRVRLAAYDRILDAIHAVPGVIAVSPTSMLPLAGEGQVNFVAPEGSTLSLGEAPTANFRVIGPEFFHALGIPIARGRTFRDNERAPDRPFPAVMSARTAARLWPNADPLGRRFSRSAGERQFEVVGIVNEAKTTSLEHPSPLMVYVPYWWRTRASTTLLVKTNGDPAAAASAMRGAVHGIDRDIAVGQMQPLARIVDRALAPRRYQMRLFVAFGIVALVIATVGVYGVTSYGVSRRRREMNIRVALGATRPQVLSLIVRQGCTPVAAGLVTGAAGALLLAGVVASLLFGVTPRDPLVISGVVMAVGGIGLLASFVAARRGLSVDPAAALRSE
jgi:putative ABC transport system permease protein